MAAPEFVPVDTTRLLRAYESPPRRPDPWLPTRPAEVFYRGQPRGPLLGYPGPDQGYVYVLTHLFEGKLTLTLGEHERDALAGGAAVALKRASLYGRAPVIHDLTVAFTIWGFLDAEPPAELVAARRPLFEDVWHPHHYEDQRHIADLVPDDIARMSPEQIAESHRRDWRSLLAEPIGHA